MSYIFISKFLEEELDYPDDINLYRFKKHFTRSVRLITDGPEDDGWVNTKGYGDCCLTWWIDPIEYPELKVVYIYE